MIMLRLICYSLFCSLCLPLVSSAGEFGVGKTKNCAEITKGQAKNAVKQDSIEACCAQEASKMTPSQFNAGSGQRCCIPPGGKCQDTSSGTTCCNQLSCVKDGQANPTCQQKTTYSVNDIREDKSGCADPKAPVKVLVDFTLLVNKKKVTIKDSIYCCNSTMKGNSRILPLLQQCCGTQFAPCDVFKQSKAKKYAGSLKCCGVPKLQDSLSTNCRPLNSTLKGLLPEMNLRYLMKKSGVTKDEIKRSPNGLDDGFGLCHFVQSGRWDVTKILSENVGYGIYARCNDKKERKGAGDVKNNKCSDTGDKKYMFQHKQNSNLCCNKASMMHRTKDEIIKGCCLHNQVEDHGPGKLDNSTLAGRLREDEFCSNAKIPCCIGSCTAKKCGAKKDCGDSVFLCDSAKPKDTFTMCLNDYNLSDPIDSEFKRDSSP